MDKNRKNLTIMEYVFQNPKNKYVYIYISYTYI